MKSCFRTLLPVLLTVLPLALHAESAPGTERVTVITSDSLLFDYGKQFAIFKGNVVVVDPGLRLTSQEMTVYFDAEDQVDRIVAKGGVVIQMDEINTRSGEAVYHMKTGQIILDDKPQVSRGRSVLQAERILYWRLENKLVAEPRARVLLFQDASSDKQLNF
jgi:lipopolysaccharide transport protein LptA